MNYVDQQYKDLIRELLEFGDPVTARNGNTVRVDTVITAFNMTPLVSVRKTAWKNALREWEWFMSGSNNIKDLHPAVRHWWEPWAGPDGRVMFNYGQQFRHARGTDGGADDRDQIAYLLDGIRKHPHGRRHVLTTWNAADMVHASCPITNCHGTVIQFFVSSDQRLSMTMYQRSVDVIAGLPHNWIQYWAFLLWVGHKTQFKPDLFKWIGGDVHLYDKHRELAKKILDQPIGNGPPNLVYNAPGPDPEFRADHFSLDGPYISGFTEKAELIV